jgi:hypothetical protein
LSNESMRRIVVVLSASLLLASLASTPVHATAYGTIGTFVSSASSDFAPGLSTPAIDYCIGYVKDPSFLTDASKRAWIFHVGNDADCTDDLTASSRSFRITNFGGTTSRTWLTSSDTTYINKAFDEVFSIASSAWLCMLESDGLPGWSPGDGVYVDTEVFDGGASGALTANDLRLIGTSTALNSPVTTTAGIVKSGDADLTLANKVDDDPTLRPTTATFACGASAPSAVTLLDLGIKGTYDNQDNYYLSLTAPDYVTQGMARLAGPSSNANQVVLDTDAEVRDVLAYVGTTSPARVVTVTAGTTVAKAVYVHFIDGSGGDDRVQRNDLIVRRSSTVAAGSPGTLVSSTATGAEELMEAQAGDSLEALLYYLDADDDGLFDPTEGIYIQHPDNAAGGGDCSPGADQVCIQVNDIRVTASASKAAGSLVAATDTDYTGNHATRTGETDLFLKLFSAKGDTRTQLTKVTNAKFNDADNDNLWDPASEDVYITSTSSSTSVANGDLRVWTGGAEDSTAITCPPGSVQCGTAYEAGNIYTTGPDATWTATSDEQLLWSHDAFLTVGDYRLQTLGSLDDGLVSSTDVGLGRGLLQSSGTTLYASVDSGCSGACFPFPQIGDVQLYPSFGTVLTSSSTQVVPQVTVVTPRLVRADFDVQNDLVKDAYYIDFGTTFAASQVWRATTLDASLSSKPAGNFLTSADTTELGATKIVSAGGATAAMAYRIGTSGGFSTDSTVYIDLPVDLGAAGTGTVTQWDARLTPYGSLAAGTRVKTGDTDSSGAPAVTGTAFKFLWWDGNRDGTADSQDFFWLHQGTDTPTAPGFLDVRLGGSAGVATSSVVPGGSPTVVTTATTSSTTTSTTGTSSTTSDSETGSTTESSTSQQGGVDDLAAANQAIADSLDVNRKDGENVLTWDSQAGVDGYQVFSSDSPFVLLTTLQGQDQSSYTDPDGGKDTKYLVTAYIAGSELTAEDVNNGDVPGYTGVPAGKDAPAGKKGFIPSPGFALVTMSIAALALVLRRRLD